MCVQGYGKTDVRKRSETEIGLPKGIWCDSNNAHQVTVMFTLWPTCGLIGSWDFS